MVRFLISCLLIISTQAIAQSNIDSLYKIYDTRSGKEVSIAQVANAFSNADVLFFGEEHDDSIGHILEARIFEQSHKIIGDRLVLSMEMFEADIQGVVDEYLAGLISEKNFIKEARAWGNYKDYKPLVEYAKANSIKLIAANTPARYANAVTRGGLSALDKFSPHTLMILPPRPIDTATGKYYENFIEIMGGHGVMPGFHIYQSQNLWDATMAWSIFGNIHRNPKAKIMHLNSRFHTDEQLGIIAQLKKYAAKGNQSLNILNISCFYVDSLDKPNWSEFKELGDFVIMTKKFKKDKEEK